MSRDAGIDYGGYDNDGSMGMSSAVFLEDRIDAVRFESAVPGGGAGVPFWDRLAQYGVPAIADAAARYGESHARADIARAQQNGSFAGPNGRSQVPPQVGSGLNLGGVGGGSSGLLVFAVVGALLFVALRD